MLPPDDGLPAPEDPPDGLDGLPPAAGPAGADPDDGPLDDPPDDGADGAPAQALVK